jgi:hypothetical protein
MNVMNKWLPSNKQRLQNNHSLATHQDDNHITNLIKTYVLHSADGDVENGMSILNRLFPSQDQRVFREQQAQLIRCEGQARQRMLKLFYDAASDEIEQATKARYELAQLRYDAAFVEEHLHLTAHLYDTQKPQLQDAIKHLQESLEHIAGLSEEYRAKSKEFADEIYYTRLAQVLTAVRTFKQRTDTLCG